MRRTKGKTERNIVLAVTLAAVVGAMASSVYADTADGNTQMTETLTTTELVMSTDYPAVSVNAGDTVSFALDFQNGAQSQQVNLSSENLPEGWEDYFQGGENTVTGAYVKYGVQDDLVIYTVTVPEDATDGEYDITLHADGSANSDSLTLRLNVTEIKLGASTMSATYAEQEAAAGSALTYSTTLKNNALAEQSFELSADAPEGWNVAFTAEDGSTTITSVDVEGTSSASLTVTVTPPSDVTAGSYTIPVTAVSDSETVSMDLTAKITGSYDLSLTTQSGTLSFDAKANQRTSVVLDVVNNSNETVSNINLSASAPTDWEVEFSESTIDTLEAGATREVTAYVTPASSAVSGDYQISMTASGTETSADATFRVTLETQTIWGIVGIIIIAAIIAALVAVFKKFGRH